MKSGYDAMPDRCCNCGRSDRACYRLLAYDNHVCCGQCDHRESVRSEERKTA